MTNCIHGYARDGGDGKCPSCVPFDTPLTYVIKENLQFRQLLSECASFLRCASFENMLDDDIGKAIEKKIMQVIEVK